MTLAFLDTSALLKLYVAEIGSTWLTNFVADKQIVISELTLIESATALRRRYLEGIFTRRQAAALYARIRRHKTAYEIVIIGEERQIPRTITVAFNLPAPFRLRALDAIQLTASKIALDKANRLIPPIPLVFVSSDVQLLNVALSRGFTVENPENYP